MKCVFKFLFALTLSFSGGMYSHSTSARPDAVQRSQPTSAQKRVALLIGNRDYTYLRDLRNPVRDAEGMARALAGLGFEVTKGTDISTRDEMLGLVNEWSARIPANGIALFFYAGHGVQVSGSNYLLPTAINISADGPSRNLSRDPLRQTTCKRFRRPPPNPLLEESEARCRVTLQGLNLESVLGAMSTPENPGNRINIVIIDSCRNELSRSTNNRRDPFSYFTSGFSPVVGGFWGTFIAYATAPGSVASDGEGRNGLFTQHLLEKIGSPKLKIEEMFKDVRRDMISDTTNNKAGQLPWDASSLLVDFYFNPGPDGPPPETLPSRPLIGPTIRITTPPLYDPVGGDPSGTRVEGDVSGDASKGLRVVIYSWTDKWYVQPSQAAPLTEIGSDGKWAADIHAGTRYAALLVKPSFKPSSTTFKLPEVGGEIVAIGTVNGRKQ